MLTIDIKGSRWLRAMSYFLSCKSDISYKIICEICKFCADFSGTISRAGDLTGPYVVRSVGWLWTLTQNFKFQNFIEFQKFWNQNVFEDILSKFGFCTPPPNHTHILNAIMEILSLIQNKPSQPPHQVPNPFLLTLHLTSHSSSPCIVSSPDLLSYLRNNVNLSNG